MQNTKGLQKPTSVKKSSKSTFLTQKQKQKLFTEFKEMLKPLLYDYAFYAMWLSEQSDVYKASNLLSLKNRELKNEIRFREKYINSPAHRAQRLRLEEMKLNYIFNGLKEMNNQSPQA